MSTTNLALAFIASNQNSKEVTANAALDGLDRAGNSLLSIDPLDADYALTAAQFAAALVFVFTGTLSGDRVVTVPVLNVDSNPMKRLFIFSNQTDGGFNLTVAPLAGTGVTLANTGSASPFVQAEYKLLYCDATNVLSVS